MLNYMKIRSARGRADFVTFDDQSIADVNRAVAAIRALEPTSGKITKIPVWRERNLVDGGTFVEIGTTGGIVL